MVGPSYSAPLLPLGLRMIWLLGYPLCTLHAENHNSWVWNSGVCSSEKVMACGIRDRKYNPSGFWQELGCQPVCESGHYSVAERMKFGLWPAIPNLPRGFEMPPLPNDGFDMANLEDLLTSKVPVEYCIPPLMAPHLSTYLTKRSKNINFRTCFCQFRHECHACWCRLGHSAWQGYRNGVFTIETMTSSNIVHFADGSRNKEMHETPIKLILFLYLIGHVIQ